MTKGEWLVCAVGVIGCCIFLHLIFKPISVAQLELIHNNKKVFITKLELNENKVSCYKEPQHRSEQCQAITNKGFPVKFYCDETHCEFMK